MKCEGQKKAVSSRLCCRMELAGVTNMCRAVSIPGCAVKATYCARVSIGGERPGAVLPCLHTEGATTATVYQFQ